MSPDTQSKLEAAILKSLRTVIDPETRANVLRMRLVEDLVVSTDGKVNYTFHPSSPLCPIAVYLVKEIKAAVAAVPGVVSQEITVTGYVAAEELTKLINKEILTMRIAISVETNNELESAVAQHFGRCPFFALVDLEGAEVTAVEVINNPFYGNHQPGQVPGFINQQSANVMLAGGMGRRAIEFFEQFGIKAATGVSGTVRNALESYLGGELSGAAPCKESEEHHEKGIHH